MTMKLRPLFHYSMAYIALAIQNAKLQSTGAPMPPQPSTWSGSQLQQGQAVRDSH